LTEIATGNDGADGRFAGARAVVTGSSRGLGRSIASSLVAEGADVVFAGRSTATLDDAVAACGGPGRAHVFELDVSSDASIERFQAQVDREIGPVDILVNCAGISPTFEPAVELRTEEWDEVLAVNLRGPVLLSVATARSMISAGRSGAIVNVASAAGLVPVRNTFAYSVSKAALIHATRALAMELAPSGVRVNAVAPGYLATDLTAGLLAGRAATDLVDAIPMARVGEVGDVVEAVLHLLSPAASYTTGACLTIDGGYTLQLRWP
jgi:NAD(P)-dependent dehydrogenase (short-subunit alcohol dehydrogenase family)